jgi:hypothetical protein
MKRFVDHFYFNNEMGSDTNTSLSDDGSLREASTGADAFSRVKIATSFRGLLANFFMSYGSSISFWMRKSPEEINKERAELDEIGSLHDDTYISAPREFIRFTTEVDHVEKNKICEECRTIHSKRHEDSDTSCKEDFSEFSCNIQDDHVLNVLKGFCNAYPQFFMVTNNSVKVAGKKEFEELKEEMEASLNEQLPLNGTFGNDKQSVRIDLIERDQPLKLTVENPFVIRYRCRCTGFVEFAVPYVLEGDYIGTFLSGQYHTDENKNYIQNVHKRLVECFEGSAEDIVLMSEDESNGYLAKRIITPDKLDLHQKEFVDHISRIVEIVDSWKEEFYLGQFRGIQKEVLDMLMRDEVIAEIEESTEEQSPIVKVSIEGLSDYNKCRYDLQQLRKTAIDVIEKLGKELDLDVIMYLRDNADPPEYVNVYDEVGFEIHPYGCIDSSEIIVPKSISVVKKRMDHLAVDNPTGKRYHLNFNEKYFPIIAVESKKPSEKSGEITRLEIYPYSHVRIAIPPISENDPYTKYTWTLSKDGSDLIRWFNLTPGEKEFPIVVVVRFKKGWDKSNIIALEELLQIVGRYICSKGSSILSSFNSNRLKSYTLHMRHDIAQKNIGLNAWIRTIEDQSRLFFDKWDDHYSMIQADTKHKKYAKNLKDFIASAQSFSQSVSLRMNTSKYIDGVPKPEKEYFFPYEKVIYRWGNVFREECAKKGLLLDFQNVRKEDKMRPQMYADPEQIEQVTYNLLNNAIKYALPYTKVKFDCRLDSDEKYYVMRVTNYGYPIAKEDEQRIFQYQYRGRNTLDNSGEGVGLYYSKKIAKSHQGDVYLEQNNTICSYNVPMLKWYSENYEVFGQLSPNFHSVYMSEWDTLGKEERDKMLGDTLNQLSFSKANFFMNIDKPTAKITFVMKIPHMDWKVRK